MTDVRRYESVSIGTDAKGRDVVAYVPRSADIRRQVAELRPLAEARIGVPHMSVGQLVAFAVAFTRETLRKEAAS